MNAQASTESQAIPVDENGVVIRPVLEVLSRLQGGQVLPKLSVELNRVMKRVMASKTGKGGEVSLRLKVERAKNSDTAVLIEAHIAGKSPTEPVGADLLFVDDDGNLHTRNPYQRDAFEDGPAAVS